MGNAATEHIKRIDRYVKGGGVSCLSCQSDDIEGGSVEIDASAAWQNVHCNVCGGSWTDTYTLDNVENFEAGEL